MSRSPQASPAHRIANRGFGPCNDPAAVAGFMSFSGRIIFELIGFRARNPDISSIPNLNASYFLAARSPRWTITDTVRLIGDRVHLQLAPAPSTGNGWPAAGTVQDPFFRESGSKGHQVRPVTVWTETNQISSEALRALDAMANTGRHGTRQPR